MTVQWCDSHCHLQDAYVSGERGRSDVPGTSAGEGVRTGEGVPSPGDLLGAMLRRAGDAGVRSAVCIGTDPDTSKGALSVASASSDAVQLWATVGLHPHHASDGTAATLEILDSTVAGGGRVADGGRLVAVGECGLDYHYEHSPRDAQLRAFAEQVIAAQRHGLALVIHARSAWDDLFGVLDEVGVPDRTVLHCFTGGPGEARRCLDAGMFVSFSGIVTFKNAADVREAAALCPLDRLLVETDSPFLAPVPHRGRPNEPAFVPLVGAAVAALKGVEPAVVAEASAKAASAVFGLG